MYYYSSVYVNMKFEIKNEKFETIFFKVRNQKAELIFLRYWVKRKRVRG